MNILNKEQLHKRGGMLMCRLSLSELLAYLMRLIHRRQINRMVKKNGTIDSTLLPIATKLCYLINP